MARTRRGRLRVRLLIAGSLGLVALVVGARPARACGPYVPEALFTFTLHPDFPLADLAAGKLGLVQPTWARSYLYVVYHQLAGGTFDAEARRALAALWQDRLGLAKGDGEPWVVQRWQAARMAVAGEGEPPAIDTMRAVPNDPYQVYANCLDDAFVTAMRTLEARVARTGKDDPEVRAWLAAQDQVFADCSATPPTIPAALPATASAGARADRAYQIAAAELYAGRFDDAAASFRALAADAASPWAPYGSYLAGRALLRKASLAIKTPGADPAIAALAARELEAAIADPRSPALQASARDLRDLVRARTEPDAQVRALAARLAAPAQGRDVARALDDYTILLDLGLDTADNRQPSGSADADARDSLTDWLFTFQGANDKAREHAFHVFEETHSPAWLLVAIAKVAPTHPMATTLLAAADALDPRQPAFVTVAAHAARIEIARGDAAAARKRLGALLARSDLPRATVNALRGLRLAAAESVADFARFATRTPVLVAYIDRGDLLDYVTDDAALRPNAQAQPSFDADAAYLLNRQLPLTSLLTLASDGAIAVPMQRRVALAGWVRAALLEDPTAAHFAERVAVLVPELGPAVTAATAAAAKERGFVASLLMLREPGLEPWVRPGLDRSAPVGDLDTFHDNWWCDAGAARISRPDWLPDEPPAFLTADERIRADDEWARLAKLPSAPTQLAAAVIAFGRANPKDARVPEALYLAVRATHYGCTDAGSSAQSKAAFQLLHRQYPTSEWAAKTKYYY